MLDSYRGTDNVQSVFKEEKTDKESPQKQLEDVGNQAKDLGVNDSPSGVDLRQAIIHQAILERPY